MSKREDIESRRLVYTCNCGWIDRGHANPKGAQDLLDQIRKGSANPVAGQNGFKVDYTQSMSKWGFSKSAGGSFYVPYGMSAAQQSSAGLGIFQDVSNQFESMQNSFPYNLATGSGYSQEDLTSNLVGFHAAAKGKKADELIDELCKPVSNDTAYKVWDRYGDVEKNKNYKWQPVIHQCPECAKECAGEPRTFPKEFGDITPGKKGTDFHEWDKRPK